MSRVRQKSFPLPGLLFLGTIISGCSSNTTVMEPYEERLSVDGQIKRDFHSLLYFPSGTSLHYPGYVIGVEKSPTKIIGKKEGERLFQKDAVYFKEEKDSRYNTYNSIRRFQEEDSKALFVSHILKSSTISDSFTGYVAKSHCFVYNSYSADPLSKVRKGYDLRKINDWNACDISLALEGKEANEELETLYGQSADALSALQSNLINDLKSDSKSGRYTHIVVLVMGWNTGQFKAVRNFNDIIGNIAAAAAESQNDASLPSEQSTAPKQGYSYLSLDEAKLNDGLDKASSARIPFRPLVIGVTWPSWWFASFFNFLSYPNKANDADELGLTWLNYLVNKTIPDAIKISKSQVKVVMIGHSFGARAVTRALFSSPALEPSQYRPASNVSLVVGLQGAVSINRFKEGAGMEGSPYRGFQDLHDTHLALTASKHDKAAGGPVFWYDPTGSIKTWKKVCENGGLHNFPGFSCFRATDNSAYRGGNFTNTKLDGGDSGGGGISYIDTSDGITEFNSPGSEGGAHSDIYRLPMGRLLWGLIKQHAPSEDK